MATSGLSYSETKTDFMKICVITAHTTSYEPLAALSWDQNKKLYCERHGYDYRISVVENQNRDNAGLTKIGFEKIFLLKALMKENQHDWFFHAGCDTLITNFDIKLEKFIDENYHFIIAKDLNGINADVFFVRNSREGKAYIQHILDNYEKYKDHGGQEQEVMLDYELHFAHITKFLPQKLINAYDYKNLVSMRPHERPVDKLGFNGQWEKGDFLLHTPGCHLPKRLSVYPGYMSQVIK